MTPPIPSRLSRLPSLRKRRGKASNPEAERSAPPTCPPADAEPGALAAARLFGRKPDGLWRYATADDETAFYAARWNEADGKKTFRPISWGERAGWQFEAWPDHRPLFNLPDLVSKPKRRSSFARARKRPKRRRRSFPIASPQRPAAALARRPKPIGRLSRAGRS